MEEPRTLMAISHPIPQWLKPIQEEVRSDPKLQALVVRRGDGSMEIQRGPYFLLGDGIFVQYFFSHPSHHYRNTWEHS
jgi:hypothetical protein